METYICTLEDGTFECFDCRCKICNETCRFYEFSDDCFNNCKYSRKGMIGGITFCSNPTINLQALKDIKEKLQTFEDEIQIKIRKESQDD